MFNNNYNTRYPLNISRFNKKQNNLMNYSCNPSHPVNNNINDNYIIINNNIIEFRKFDFFLKYPA